MLNPLAKVQRCIDCLLYHENCTPSDSGNDVVVQEPDSNDDAFELPSK